MTKQRNFSENFNSTDVVDALTDLFILRGAPEYIRSGTRLEKRCSKQKIELMLKNSEFSDILF